MNKQEFLNALEERLSPLSTEDRRRILDYYSEAIADRMEEGLSEEAAVGDMGSLEEVVRTTLEGMPREEGARIFGSGRSLSDILRGKQSESTRSETVYEAKEAITGLYVSAGPCDVKLYPARDEKIQVVHKGDCPEAVCTAAVEKGVLRIERTCPVRPRININLKSSPAIALYLPQSRYESLEVSTGSGDVTLPADFVFGTVGITASSGDIEVFSSTEGDCLLHTSSGDIEAENLQVQGLFQAEASSGDIRLASMDVSGGIQCKTSSGDMKLQSLRTIGLSASASSGDMTLDSVSVKGELALRTASGNIELESCLAGNMRLHSVSGDVELEDCDAGSLSIDTVSGEIEGRLRTGKSFNAATTTGRIRIPPSSGEGQCTLRSRSGSIRMTVKA